MEEALGLSTSETGTSSFGSTQGLPSKGEAPYALEKSGLDSRVERNETQESPNRLHTDSEVNEIVKRAKAEAVEKFKRLYAQQPEYAQKKYGELPATAPTSSVSSESDYRRIAAEEAQRLRDEWVREAQTQAENQYAQKVVETFWNKVATGKEKYADFDAITNDIELRQFPNTVQILAEYVDNAQDMLYEFGKDRLKLAQLEQLAKMSQKDAIIQARRLSEALKVNEDALKAKIPNEPLSQLRPQSTGTATNGVYSVKDYKAKYRG